MAWVAAPSNLFPKNLRLDRWPAMKTRRGGNPIPAVVKFGYGY